MNMQADSYTTFRKHARPICFAGARDEAVRRILSKIPFGATASSVAVRMGLEFTKRDLYDLREGDLRNISDNRLFLWCERLQVPLELRFG